MFFKWLEDATQHHGGAHAVVQRETYLSFRGLLHRSGRRMQELRALGIAKGDAVGIMLGNVADYLVIAVAVNRLGAALVPIAPLCSARELAAIQRIVPLRALVTRPGAKALERSGKGAQPSPEPSLPAPEPTKRTRLQGSLLSCALFKPLTDAPALPPEAVLVHVRPGPGADYRPIFRTAQVLAAEAENLAAALEPGDRVHLGVGLPIYQPLGLELSLGLTIGYGAELHLDDDLAPRRTLQRIREAKLNLLPVTRAVVRAFNALPGGRPVSGDVRFLCVDGAVGRELAKEIHRRYGIWPRGAFHLPDTGMVSLDTDGRHPQTVGVPLQGVSVRVVGAQGKPVANGRRGVLQVRSPAVSHWNGNGSARGWVNTGEQAQQDKEGRLKLLSRVDDLCLVEGLEVSLEEVREALLVHPSVDDARVDPPGLDQPVGIDGTHGVRARVKLRKPISPDRLAAHCARLLSPHKVPREVEPVKRLD